jgi:hypothetical protein
MSTSTDCCLLEATIPAAIPMAPPIAAPITMSCAAERLDESERAVPLTIVVAEAGLRKPPSLSRLVWGVTRIPTASCSRLTAEDWMSPDWALAGNANRPRIRLREERVCFIGMAKVGRAGNTNVRASRPSTHTYGYVGAPFFSSRSWRPRMALAKVEVIEAK